MATKVFIIFGRFQPPTIGHERLFNTALQRANVDSADVAVFVSQTEDNKNPIPYAEKVKVIRKSVPRIIIGPKTVRTPAEALTWAFDRGYQDIRLLVQPADHIAEIIMAMLIIGMDPQGVSTPLFIGYKINKGCRDELLMGLMVSTLSSRPESFSSLVQDLFHQESEWQFADELIPLGCIGNVPVTAKMSVSDEMICRSIVENSGFLQVDQ